MQDIPDPEEVEESETPNRRRGVLGQSIIPSASESEESVHEEPFQEDPDVSTFFQIEETELNNRF